MKVQARSCTRPPARSYPTTSEIPPSIVTMAPKVKDKVLVVDKDTHCMNDDGNLHKGRLHLGQEQVRESMHKLKKIGNNGSIGSSRHSSEKSAARCTEEQKRKIEEYPHTHAIFEMVEAVGQQEEAERAEQLGNHFAADAAKEWRCSSCTRINKATDNACASCNKANLVGVEDDPTTLHDIQVAKNQSMMRKRPPKGSMGKFYPQSISLEG